MKGRPASGARSPAGPTYPKMCLDRAAGRWRRLWRRGALCVRFFYQNFFHFIKENACFFFPRANQGFKVLAPGHLRAHASVWSGDKPLINTAVTQVVLFRNTGVRVTILTIINVVYLTMLIMLITS